MTYQPLALQLDPNRRDGGEMADGRSNENDIGRSKRLQPIYAVSYTHLTLPTKA